MANTATAEMYIIVKDISEHQEIHELFKDEIGPDYEYPEIDEDIEFPYKDFSYPHQLELNFDSKWGLPKSLLKVLVDKFPNMNWNVTSSESGCSYRGLAWYHPNEENLMEPAQIQIYESNL